MSVSPDIERLVKELLKEDSHYDRVENRSAHREHLVRAVDVAIRGSEGSPLQSFSRNISSIGIGLITAEKIEEGKMAVLTIHRLSGNKASSVLAECRWCKPYGADWQISGWRFISIHR